MIELRHDFAGWRKTAFVILLGVFSLLLFAGCQEDTTVATKTVTQIDGTQWTVPMEAQRIGAVYGPAYEAMVVLGAEDRVVVCSDVQFENFPWAVKIFKRISTLPYLKNVHSAVSVETLLSYSPDLVFTFPRPTELRQLEAAGVAVIPGVTTEKLSDTKALLYVYAEALGGDALERAEAYDAYFDERVAYVQEKTAGLSEAEKPKVYYAGIDMLTTYGKYSDICDLISIAGGIPVAQDLEGGNRVQINFEQLAAWNPDYIFIDHGAMNDRETAEEILAGAYDTEIYQAINAVKNQQLYLSPSGVFYWDMGLQKILLLQYVAKTIHPELFADLDMTVEIQRFYQQFFDYDLTLEEAQQILNRVDISN